MSYQTKQIIKDDGRYLVLYHFPETATPDQVEAFAAAQGQAEEQQERGADAELPVPSAGAVSEDNPRV